MIHGNVVVITFTDEEMNAIYAEAKRVAIGGISSIRETESRKRNLYIDQVTGMCCEAAWCKFKTGSIALWLQSRNEQAQHPKTGSYSDLLGFPVDIKGSRMRRGKDFPYNLFVRPREYAPEKIYVLALMEENRDNIVYLMGQTQGRNIPRENEKWGDVYRLRQDKLQAVTHAV